MKSFMSGEGSVAEGEPRPEGDNGMLGIPAQLLAALRNARDIARMGRLEQTAKTPCEVVLRRPTFKLRRYLDVAPRDVAEASRPAILMVPPLMITAEVYDIAPGGSAVESLLALGIDPWVVDFGAPERQEGALQRTLTDHVVAVSDAVDFVREATGRDVHLAGYSQGGIFVYLAAALRRSEGLASLVTFGSPVNVHSNVLPGIPDEIALPLVEGLGSLLTTGFARTAVPAWLSRNAFRLMSPTKEIQNQLEFLRSLHDRDALARKEGQRRFLADEGWVAWPGPAFREFVEQMIMGNRLFSGGFVVEGQTVTLADITCPVLVFVGTRDDIARPPLVRSVGDAAPRAELWEASVRAGHMGLVVGSTAARDTWPTVAAWTRWRENDGPRPALVVPLGQRAGRPISPGDMEAVEPGVDAASGDETVDEDEEFEGSADRGLLWVAGELGRGAVSMMFEAATGGAEAVWSIGSSLTRQIPRLARLEGLRRDTRIGIALTLAEQAETSPDGTFFLYEGRAHSFADADRRVDAIVRGLLQIGVRAGENVGVLMHTRPTALALVAAVNRLGAVAVLLRPDADLASAITVGGVEHLVSDPDHAATATKLWTKTVYVLGGVHAAGRALPGGAVDMERIDPARVAVPEWYSPSPGRAEDVAFVFFAGRGAALRANRITNRRWALSAYGTASAAALTQADTVYSWAPIQHPTGLLVSHSAALAAGARLAMAKCFSATTFWEEVRRYGASVVFYTGIMLRELVDAPHDAAERKHPLRMFAGSGMPRALWQKVVDRFGPIDVLEFYASTEGNAVLANVSGKRIGSVGRPLPGSSEVRLAAWNVEENTPVFTPFGYVRAAERGEIGMMLARVDRERGALAGKPLRNVFERDDAWTATGSLFTKDALGDYWLVDHRSDLIRTSGAWLPSIPVEDAVWEVHGVSAAAAFGLAVEGMDGELPAVAIAMRAGFELEPDALARKVVEKLDAASRPRVVRVMTELPTTSGYRTLKSALRSDGIPPGYVEAGRIFVWNAAARSYEKVESRAVLRDLLASAR
jgi:putative long chain acyl-CoA synthase